MKKYSFSIDYRQTRTFFSVFFSIFLRNEGFLAKKNDSVAHNNKDMYIHTLHSVLNMFVGVVVKLRH